MSAWSNIKTVMKRELGGYFNSPVAYVFIVIFLLMMGIFTFMFGFFFERQQASLKDSFFFWHPWLYLFLVPAVAMRLWSEERRQGTLELLLTMPITGWQAIVGKFLASWIFLALALALTFPIVITVNWLGDPDNGAIFCGYLGSLLLAGAYLAIGCLTSAMTRNQVISFIVSLVLCFALIALGWDRVTDGLGKFLEVVVGERFAGTLIQVMSSSSVLPHFDGFQRGVLDLRDFLFFGSIIGFALFCTGVVLRNLRSGH